MQVIVIRIRFFFQIEPMSIPGLSFPMQQNPTDLIRKRTKLTLPDVEAVLREKMPDTPFSGQVTKSDEHRMLRVLVGALVESSGY